MKEKEVYVEDDSLQLVIYVEKDDDSYGPLLTGSFMTKNYLDDYLEKVNKWERDLREKLKKGEISPVYYFMILQSYGEKDLASRVGVSRRQLKKHCEMKGFERLHISKLKEYAEAFDIPVNSFFNILITDQDKVGDISIKTMKTKNPYFSITKVELDRK